MTLKQPKYADPRSSEERCKLTLHEGPPVGGAVRGPAQVQCACERIHPACGKRSHACRHVWCQVTGTTLTSQRDRRRNTTQMRSAYTPEHEGARNAMEDLYVLMGSRSEMAGHVKGAVNSPCCHLCKDRCNMHVCL